LLLAMIAVPIDERADQRDDERYEPVGAGRREREERAPPARRDRRREREHRGDHTE
jgi:hypothetical protein